jgi:hypothetical protein
MDGTRHARVQGRQQLHREHVVLARGLQTLGRDGLEQRLEVMQDRAGAVLGDGGFAQHPPHFLGERRLGFVTEKHDNREG